MSGRRGGRASGGGLPRSVQVSKKLSWLLRHHAASQGLSLGPGGYASVKDVLNTQACRSLNITFEEIQTIVADNEKQRFSLKPISDESDLSDIEPEYWLIRANQGHSIQVEDDGLLTPISQDDAASLPQMVVHGTSHTAWRSIIESGGLKPMGRNHIHFATGLPAGFGVLKDEASTASSAGQPETSATELQSIQSAPVTSGMRSSSSILIYIDLPAALKDGVKFGRSENGVILTAGNHDGLVPTKYFKLVEERKAGCGILMRDGEVQKELPKHLGSHVSNGKGRERRRGG